MNQTTKIAIVGLGRIGWRFHFQQALSSDQFELTAVVDPLPERLSEARAAAGCETHTDFESLWSGPSPDVVAIATPTTLHEDMTIRALNEGCHVILEKPMTTSLASADRMIAQAEKNNRRIFLYQPHRLTPETQTAREIIQSGMLGPIYAIHRGVYRYVRRNDWQSLRKNGGGMLNNYGAHYLDQLIYLSDDSAITEVDCKLWAIATRGDADDVVKAWVKKRIWTTLRRAYQSSHRSHHAPLAYLWEIRHCHPRGQRIQSTILRPRRSTPAKRRRRRGTRTQLR